MKSVVLVKKKNERIYKIKKILLVHISEYNNYANSILEKEDDISIEDVNVLLELSSKIDNLRKQLNVEYEFAT